MSPDAHEFLLAARAFATGRPVIVVNALLGVAAFGLPVEAVDEVHVNILTTECRGMIYVGVAEEQLTRMGVPRQISTGIAASNFFVAVDLAAGTTTGISAADRTRTIRALATPTTVAGAFNLPGHVIPLALHRDGIAGRWGTAEAFSDIARAAGLTGTVVFATILSTNGETGDQVVWDRLAATRAAAVCSVADALRGRRRQTDPGWTPNRASTLHSLTLPYTGSSLICLVKGAGNVCEKLPVFVEDQCLPSQLEPDGCGCHARLDRHRRALRSLETGAICLRQRRDAVLACPTEQLGIGKPPEAIADLVAAHFNGARPTPYG